MNSWTANSTTNPELTAKMRMANSHKAEKYQE
jgi:hypothetical protein